MSVLRAEVMKMDLEVKVGLLRYRHFSGCAGRKSEVELNRSDSKRADDCKVAR